VTTWANRNHKLSQMGMRCPVGPQFMPKLMPPQSTVDMAASIGKATRAKDPVHAPCTAERDEADDRDILNS